MYLYKAFGLIISSDTEILQLHPLTHEQPINVAIKKGNLLTYRSKLPANIHNLLRINEFFYEIPNVGSFLIQDANKIIYDPDPRVTLNLLSVYLMGPCMGGILHQRGTHPLHCSCIANNKHAVMICGDSGAGKSTLASEFLKNGWKLLTDDVAAVENVDNIPIVQPSYPSQKLWQDSLERYKRYEGSIHSLYGRSDGMKYGVDVSGQFLDEPRPLSLIVRLIPDNGPCSLRPITGMAKIDQLMKNTYNAFMILPEEKQKFFQRCVTLSTKAPMVLATRETKAYSAPQLFKMITSYLEEC